MTNDVSPNMAETAGWSLVQMQLHSCSSFGSRHRGQFGACPVAKLSWQNPNPKANSQGPRRVAFTQLAARSQASAGCCMRAVLSSWTPVQEMDAELAKAEGEIATEEKELLSNIDDIVSSQAVARVMPGCCSGQPPGMHAVRRLPGIAACNSQNLELCCPCSICAAPQAAVLLLGPQYAPLRRSTTCSTRPRRTCSPPQCLQGSMRTGRSRGTLPCPPATRARLPRAGRSLSQSALR